MPPAGLLSPRFRPHRARRNASLLGGAQQLPLAMATVLALPVLPGGGVNDLFTNRVFLAGFSAWFTAQTLKVRRGAGRPRRWRRGCCNPRAAAPRRCVRQRDLRRHPVPTQIFTKRLKKGVWDLRAIVDSGGMPSSHSALCAVSLASGADGCPASALCSTGCTGA